jgi:RHS repeat-associated protein
VIRNQERGKGELTAPGGQQEERHDDTDGDDNGQVGYFVTDHLGRTPIERGQATKMINSNGTTFPNGTNFEIKYYSWGADQPDIPVLGTSFKYTGQRQAEAGLYFYNARWYDPQLGRFIQADTIIPEPGNPLAWDRYAYANNNPLYYTDPSGHKVCEYEYEGECVTDIKYQIFQIEEKYSVTLSGNWNQDKLDLFDAAMNKAISAVGGKDEFDKLINGGLDSTDDGNLIIYNTSGSEASAICGGQKVNACWTTKMIVIGDNVFLPSYQNTRVRPKEINLWGNIPLGIQTTFIHELGHVVVDGLPFLPLRYALSVDNSHAFGNSIEESFVSAVAFYIVTNGSAFPGYQDQFDFIKNLFKK